MKIAIVHENPRILEILKEVLVSITEYKIIWVANSGQEAIEKCEIELPDLLLLHIRLPDMDGVAATRIIMKNTPCAILILTESIEDNASKVFEAMGYGALDVVHTPKDMQGWAESGVEAFVKKIETFKFLLGKNHKKIKRISGRFSIENGKAGIALPPLVLIGASTGGPLAISKILRKLPKDFKGSIIITQHVDQQFIGGFAKWLAEQTSLNVELAKDGSRPNEGVVLVAGTNNHLRMTYNLDLEYTDFPLDNFYKPSIDVLFESSAHHWPQKGMAILLTGMGKDGAKGLKTLYNAGWYTLAEDETSCIVYGMPKAAIEFQAVKKVLPLEYIADEICNFVNSKTSADSWRSS